MVSPGRPCFEEEAVKLRRLFPRFLLSTADQVRFVFAVIDSASKTGTDNDATPEINLAASPSTGKTTFSTTSATASRWLSGIGRAFSTTCANSLD
jgi:hypothetical protein